MAQAPTQDFIVNSGLSVLGTSVVTSSTGNTGTLQVDGGAAVAKNLIVGSDTEIYGDLTVHGNLPFLSITTGTFTNLTVTGLSTLNAVTLGISTATQLDVAARLMVGGLSQLNNATLASGINSTSSTTGALTVAGGVGIEKDLWVGGRAWVNGYEVLTTATDVASTLEEVALQGSSTTIAISILSTVSSTSTNSGALIITGGIGVGGDIYANAVYANTSSYINNSLILTTATIGNFVVSSITAGTDTVVSTSTGDVIIWNDSTLQTVTSRGATTNQAIIITNSNAATSTLTGALIITGGIGIGGDLYSGKKLYVGDGTVTYASLTTATSGLYASRAINLIDANAVVKVSRISNTNAPAIELQAVNTSGIVRSYWDVSVSTGVGGVDDNMGFRWRTTNLSSAGGADRLLLYGTGTALVVIPMTTATNSTATGAFVVKGGVGIGGGLFVGGVITATNTTSAFSTTTGALQIAGGVGIGGSLYVGDATYINDSLVLSTATINGYAVTSIIAGTDTSVSGSTGAVTIWNTSTLQTITDRGAETANAIAISNITPSTSSVSGALTVGGGVGIGENLYVGGIIYGTLIGSGSISTASNLASGTAGQVPYQTAPGVTSFYGPGTAGNVLVSNGTSAPTYNNTLTLTSTLSNTTTVVGNAFQVVGGVGINGSLFVDGPAYFQNNVVFSGTSTSIFSTTTVYTDNYIELHYPSGSSGSGVWTVDDGQDIGHIYHHYKDSSGDEHGALIWHNLSDELRWYMGGVDLNTSTQVWDVTTATFGVFRTGSMLLEDVTTATSTTTGTLVVVGGVGIGGSIYVGQTGTFNSVIINSTTPNANTTNSGALQIAGGIGVGGGAKFGNIVTATTFSAGTGATGDIRITNSQIYKVGGAINITGGGASAPSISGGSGLIAGNNGPLDLYGGFGGNINLRTAASYQTVVVSSSATISTQTGALQVVGGVGIGGGLFVGGISTFVNVINATSATFSGTLGVTGTSVLNGLRATNIVASGTLGVTGTSTLNVLNATSATFSGITTVTNTTAATSTSTGALQVIGGVGIGGALYVQETSYVNGSQIITAATLGNFGVSTITAGTDTVVSSSTGSVLIWNTSTLQSITDRGYTTTNQIIIANLVTATNTQTGALQVIGGVGIGGNLYVGSTSVLNGVQTTNIVASGTLGVTGTTTLNVLNATSATFSGTLGVTGTSVLNGLQASNIVASGTLGVTGTTTLGLLNGTSATFSGTLGVTGTSVLTGLRATNIVASGTLGVTGTTTLNVLNATSATFSGTLGVTGTTTLNVLNATSATFSGTLGVTGTSVFAGVTVVSNTTSATSTTTGALQVIGGVGIGGALYVQRTSYVNNAEILTTATIGLYGVSTITAGTDTVVSTSTGAVLIWNTSTLQSVTNRGASTTNLVTFNNGVIFGSTANVPIEFNGNYTNSNGTFIRANGFMVGTTTTTVLYALNFQHNVAPVSTTTIGSYYGNLFLPTLQNTATYGSMYGTFARIDMAAAATSGTVGTWYGFFSATPTRNAAANVPFTNHIGFYAQDPSSAITATNVYGVQSVIASGTNRYNIYASGTADNYFNGNVGIGGLPTVKLDITGAVKISGITTVTNVTAATNTSTGAFQVRGGVGVGGSIYVGDKVGFVNTSNVSAVYQVYNAVTNSLDTVFA